MSVYGVIANRVKKDGSLALTTNSDISDWVVKYMERDSRFEIPDKDDVTGKIKFHSLKHYGPPLLVHGIPDYADADSKTYPSSIPLEYLPPDLYQFAEKVYIAVGHCHGYLFWLESVHKIPDKNLILHSPDSFAKRFNLRVGPALPTEPFSLSAIFLMEAILKEHEFLDTLAHLAK